MKKPLSVLLALALAFGLLALAPITASAAPPVGPSPIAIWDFRIVDADGSGTYNGGSWSWVRSTKTLTLTNITHSTSADAALALPSGATIVLSGTNALTSTPGSGLNAFGIYGLGALTITGDGILNATGGPVTTSGRYSYGARVGGDLTISGGATVTAAGGATGNPSYGIMVTGSLIISSGTVTASGNSRAIESDYTVPSGYAYVVSPNANGAPATSGISSGSTVVGSTHKYARIVYIIHTHSFGAAWVKDATGHWKECACGEKDGFAPHNPGGWIVDKPATATEDGSQHKECTDCGYVTETGTIPATGVNTIFSTRYEANFLNWLLFFLGFGFIWMWF